MTCKPLHHDTGVTVLQTRMFSTEGPSFWELARQALSSTQSGYDLLAPKFDNTPFRTPDAIVEAVLADVPGPLEAGVDLCCGTGAALPALAARCRRVVGVDFSPGMLEIARARACTTIANVEAELVQLDVFDFQEPSTFDVVTCFGAFGHIRPHEEAQFVARVHDLLRPGGCFVFASARMPPRLSLPFALSKLFNAAMHARNTVYKPAFVMFYLTFMLPNCAVLLENSGFDVHTRPANLPAPMDRLEVVTARRWPE